MTTVPVPDLPEIGPGYLLRDRYKIKRKLGGGAFGFVFLAHDNSFEKDVAVKVLRLADVSRMMNPADAKKRFLREARLLAKLEDHKNVVRVRDVGEEAGVPYFVMDYLPGGTLHDVIQKTGKVAPQRAASMAADVASALAAVHANGTIHRDLKPGNIFIKGEAALLGDFGIAHVPDETRITSGEGAPGTPMYMSPEALRGRDVDTRTDLFSLGCVLYEALVGEVLFLAPTLGEVVGRILDTEEVDLAPLHGKIPERLLTILKRAVAKNRQERYATAAQMELDLRDFVQWSHAPIRGQGAAPGPPRRAQLPAISPQDETVAVREPKVAKPPAGTARRGWWIAGSAVALLATGIFVGFLIRSSGSPAPVTRRPEPVKQQTTLPETPSGENPMPAKFVEPPPKQQVEASAEAVRTAKFNTELDSAKAAFADGDWAGSLYKLYRLRNERKDVTILTLYIKNANYNWGIESLSNFETDNAIEHFKDALEMAPGDPAIQKNIEVASRYRRHARDAAFDAFLKTLKPNNLEDK